MGSTCDTFLWIKFDPKQGIIARSRAEAPAWSVNSAKAKNSYAVNKMAFSRFPSLRKEEILVLHSEANMYFREVFYIQEISDNAITAELIYVK